MARYAVNMTRSQYFKLQTVERKLAALLDEQLNWETAYQLRQAIDRVGIAIRIEQELER